MESDVYQNAVLLGLAEVKVPFKNLTKEERVRIVHICYRRLLEIETTDNGSEEETLKCIGVVDSFYALQEVEFTITRDICRLFRKTEIILEYTLKDVIIALPALDYPSRIIIVSRTQGFGRTTLVLQMQSKETVQTLLQKFSSTDKRLATQRIPTNSKSNGRFRRGADSFGKVMGKKMNRVLNSLGTTSDRDCQDSGSVQCAETSPSDTPFVSEEEDELNADSEPDDNPDSEPQNHYIINVPYEPRPSFNKASMSPLEAEIEYLIQSEITFVDSLKKLLDFKMILNDAVEIIKRKHSDQMLMYIEEMYIFHKELLGYLKSCKTNIDGLCSIFKENSDNFRYHVFYISNIPVAEKIYNGYSEMFRQTNSSLAEDLRKPRMRLNHYILTFESLKKNCTEENSSKVQEIIEVFKAYLKEADTRIITDSVNLCPFNLIEYGHLVMNGELSLKKGEGLNKRRYQVLLLENLLVLAKGSQDLSEYVTSFYFRDTVLAHKMRGVMIHLNVKQKERTTLLIFKAKTINLQQKWIGKLKSRIDTVEQTNREESVQNGNGNSKNGELVKDESCSAAVIETISKGNGTSVLINCMPPLTIPVAFRKKEFDLKSKQYKDNLLLYVRDIQESEKLLIRNVDHILSQNRFESDLSEISDDVRHLYEFHLRYFYPAITYDQKNFEEHVCRCISKKREAFIDSSSRMLYLAAVLKYEKKTQFLPPVFEVAVDNFFKYKMYFSKTEFTSDVMKQKLRVKEVEEIFEEILMVANSLLKQKYIPEFPFKTAVVMEGVLSVRESLEEVDHYIYIILTEENIYFLSVMKTKLRIHASFKNEEGRLGQPTGIKSFQINFSTLGKRKRKFNFTATNIETKTVWVSSFNKVLPQEFKRREFIRISERMRTKSANLPSRSLSDCITRRDFPPTVSDRRFAKLFIESEL